MVRESRLKLSLPIPEISKEDLADNLGETYEYTVSEIGGDKNGQSS